MGLSISSAVSHDQRTKGFSTVTISAKASGQQQSNQSQPSEIPQQGSVKTSDSHPLVVIYALRAAPPGVDESASEDSSGVFKRHLESREGPKSTRGPSGC